LKIVDRARIPARYQIVILLAILTVAFLLRIYGINYDLPFLYDQDEPIFVTHALGMLKNHDLNPHWFGAPASTTMYLLALLYAAIFAGGRVLGIFNTAEDFRNLYYANPTMFYLTGRIVSVLFGVATIWLIYKLGRKLFNPLTGLIASAILSLSPVHISLSQQVRMDVQMTFLLVLALWYCLNILERQDWKSYLLAGFVTGLATVTKYPAVVFTLTVALTHFLSTPSRRLSDHRKLAGSAAACVFGAFIGAPYVFLDFRSVLRDVATEARPEHLGAVGEGLLRNLGWYLSGPIPASISFVGSLSAAAGLIMCLATKDKRRWVLVSFPLLFLVFISSLNLRWERWVLPVIPFLCLLLTYAVSRVTGGLSSRLGPRWATATSVVLLLLIIGPLFKASVIHARDMASPYTSTLVREWLMKHIPAQSRVLLEVYGPQLPAGRFNVLVIQQDGRLAPADETFGNVQPSWEAGRLKDAEELKNQNVQYVVLSNEMRFFAEAGKYPKEVSTYEKLIYSGRLVFDTDRHPQKTRGARVRVFELSPATP
jgi:4-amino-4-deoxy-L-arabinose transferase-like glycosyltransferase